MTTSAPVPAVVLAGALRHRVLNDLSTEGFVGASLPAFLWRCSLNEFLGVFRLFLASRLRQLVASPLDLPNATGALRLQAAVAIKVSNLVESWPMRWHEMLEVLRSTRGGDSEQLATRLITSSEAAAPYLFLQRPLWSQASAFPKELRMELDAQLRKRRTFVGPRRYFIDGAAERHVRRRSSERLRYLLATRGNAFRADSDDRLSAAAVQDLFSATDYQLAVLRRLGVLKSARWTTVRELELAMCKLARHSRLRRPTVDRDVVPLSEFSPVQGHELELHLRNVMAGSTPSVYWGSTQIPGLRNLFIPSSYAKAACSVELKN